MSTDGNAACGAFSTLARPFSFAALAPAHVALRAAFQAGCLARPSPSCIALQAGSHAPMLSFQVSAFLSIPFSAAPADFTDREIPAGLRF